MIEDFGTVLRNIRVSRHMTLEEMAALLGTTKQALSRYERGERTPKITAAARFAEVLGIPLENLIGYEYHESDPPQGNEPQTYEAKLLAKGMDRMPEALRKAIMVTLEYQYPGFFEEGNDNDDT